jgi:hypothetical protein
LIESRSTGPLEQKELMLPQYYLIVGHGSKGLELPHIYSNVGQEILPVFFSERAAQEFLSLSPLGEGWDVRSFSGGDLVSMLFAFHARIKGVSLDPQHGALWEDVALSVVGRNAFVSSLLETRSYVPAVSARS